MSLIRCIFFRNEIPRLSFRHPKEQKYILLGIGGSRERAILIVFNKKIAILPILKIIEALSKNLKTFG
jgi:hypothetical protein